MLLSLGHVTVRSADFERTERFYCGLLGMRRGPRPAIAVPGHWFYVGSEAVLHVLPRLAGATQDARQLARKGVTLPAQDLVIAACAIRIEAAVLTYDHHFFDIPGVTVLSSLDELR